MFIILSYRLEFSKRGAKVEIAFKYIVQTCLNGYA